MKLHEYLLREQALFLQQLGYASLSEVPDDILLSLDQAFHSQPHIVSFLAQMEKNISNWSGWKKALGVATGGVSTLFDKSTTTLDKIKTIASGGAYQVHKNIKDAVAPKGKPPIKTFPAGEVRHGLPPRRHEGLKEFQPSNYGKSLALPINPNLTGGRAPQVMGVQAVAPTEEPKKKMSIPTMAGIGVAGVLVIGLIIYFLMK